MRNASARRVLGLWRSLTWLVPGACLVPLGFLAYVAAVGLRSPASTWSRSFWLPFVVYIGPWQALHFVLGVTAAILARRGADRAAVVVLAALCAATLSGVRPLWTYLALDFSLFSAMPGIVAAGIVVLGLPLLRRGPIVAWLAVIALCALPAINAELTLISIEQNLIRLGQNRADECPPGPSIDLLISGAATGHYSVACGLPKSRVQPAGRIGCDRGSVTVSFLAGHDVWYLYIPPAPSGVTVTGRLTLAPSLIASGNAYGGQSGWTGSYTFDSECSGRIDADLFSGPNGGSHVHVRGRFATVRS